MRALVKLGGTLLDSEESRSRLAREIAEAARVHELVVVHGGGKQMTRYLADRGVETRFVRGLRVTTPDVVDALLKVFAGSVNHQLVGSLQAAGARAAGLSGLDSGIAVAEQLDPELGAVGRVIASDPSLLRHLTQGGFIPVVACVAGGRGGEVFNVNADQMAVALAAALQADALIFLTDVDGVRGHDGSRIETLTLGECRQLIEDQVATGGMEAKLNASILAVEKGVGRVAIAPGATSRIVDLALKGRAGTTIGQ